MTAHERRVEFLGGRVSRKRAGRLAAPARQPSVWASVKGLSAATIARLKGGWENEYAQWRARDWAEEEFVYLWADGIYVNVRSEERRCLLVVVGCDARGRKRLPGPRSGLPRVGAELEGGSVEPAGPGGEGGEAGGGRRGAGVLVGPGRGVSPDPGAALPGAQDGERARQAAQTHSWRSEVDAA